MIKQHPCDSKKELEAEKATNFRNNKYGNRNIPCRSQKEYREINKEKLQEYFKNYNTINRKKNKPSIYIMNQIQKNYKKKRKNIVKGTNQ